MGTAYGDYAVRGGAKCGAIEIARKIDHKREIDRKLIEVRVCSVIKVRVCSVIKILQVLHRSEKTSKIPLSDEALEPLSVHIRSTYLVLSDLS